MQNIENDMDELFRRAAEKYPLNSGNSAWDKIEAKLSDQFSEGEKVKSGKPNNSKGKLFILMLLLFLIIGFLILWPWSFMQQSGKTPAKENQQNGKVGKNFVPKDKVFDNLNRNVNAKNVKVTGLQKMPQKNLTDLRKEKNYNRKSRRIYDNGKDEFSQDGNAIYSQANEKKVPMNNYRKSDLAAIWGKKENKDDIKKEEFSDQKPEKVSPDSLENNLTSNEKKKVAPLKKASKQKGFYIGVTGDADFSKVKTTSFEGPAFGAGMMAGYLLSKRFFIETGLVWFQKNYYSLGDAFYEKGVSMPQGMVINNLHSRSKILEIPLKAGFYFYEGKKNKWFVATGASAYVMMNEKNSYNVTMNGTPEKMNGIYSKNNTKIPAVVFINAGFQHNITNSLNIIIEPYLKLPVTGIGVGKLPVTSAGIQVGISRNFK